MVWGLVPSPLIEADTLPALSTVTTETLKPSLVHCSSVPWMIAIAIAMEMFFSTCGACAEAGAAASMDTEARTARVAERMLGLLESLFLGPLLNPRRRRLIRAAHGNFHPAGLPQPADAIASGEQAGSLPTGRAACRDRPPHRQSSC